MSEGTSVAVSGAVEGPTDEAILHRLIAEAGASLGGVYGKNGKHHLHQKLYAYNQAARQSPWVVLVDLDMDADCAPPFCTAWLPQRSPRMCFRVAVRAVEAWLMADRERLAKFLGVPLSRVPLNPETVADPKAKMVDLAKMSRMRSIREDMVPRPDSGRAVGPAYPSRLIEFATTLWRPEVAANRADSLARCRIRIQELVSART
jgi:hypothetical protein